MNIFLVTSPLQYLCADEARRLYATKDNVMVLVEPGNAAGDKQLERIFVSEDWDCVINLPRKKRSKNVPLVIKKLRKMLEKNECIEHFFYAELNAWRTKLICRNLPVAKEVYFDDGTATLVGFYNIVSEKKPYYRPRFFPDLLVRLRGLAPVGKMPFPENFEIFTIFDLPEDYCRVRRNPMRRLKERLGGAEVYHPEAPVGFIGQGSVGARGGLDLKPYLEVVERFTSLAGRQVIYFPHRNEIPSIRDAINAIEGLKIHDSELPLELELADKGVALSGMGGMMSTALITVSLLYEELPIHVARNQGEHYEKDRYDMQGTAKIVEEYYRRMNVHWF